MVSKMPRKVYSVNYEIDGTLSSIAPPLLQAIEDFKTATHVEETTKVHVSIIMTLKRE
jgi:hypothetical protein